MKIMPILVRMLKSEAINRPVFAPLRYLLFKIRLNLWNMSKSDRAGWKARIHDVLTCSELKMIDRVSNAGKVEDGYLIMHNGLKIEPLSYYGYPMLNMFMKSRGVHEPQEERIFGEVLKVLPKSAVMIELGSYWAFYSMWFCKVVVDARCFLIEPTAEGLEFGRKNFALNGMSGDFTRAFIGATSDSAGSDIDTITLDDFTGSKGLGFADIVHSDIQGFEYAMLQGGDRMLSGMRVGYWFISTHSNELHHKCVEKLRQNGYDIVTSIDLDDTYSIDGIIVARSPSYPAIGPIEISRKSTRQSNSFGPPK